MKIGRARFALCIIAACLILSRALAQIPEVRFDGKLTPLGDSLRDRGVDLSQSSLIAAPRHGDPEIRSLAALKLAEDHDAYAVSPIADALSIEKNTQSRIAMSEALWSLKDPRGLASLQAMCADTSLPINSVVEAVQQLNIIGESSSACAATIFGYLDSHPGAESRKRVLSALVEMYRWISPSEAERIAHERQNLLADSEPYTRIAASD